MPPCKSKEFHVNLSGFSDLPSVVLQSGQNRFRALLDSGAMCSIAHYNVYQKTPKHLKSAINRNSGVQLRAVNGNSVSSLGEVELKFRIGKTFIKHKFQLSSEISHSLILGIIRLQYMSLYKSKESTNS